MTDLALLIGRVLFGGLFILNGLNHLRNRAAMTGYASYKGLPAPGLAVVGSGLWMLVCGFSIILGIRPYIGALMAAVFLLAVTPVMHNYWTIADENQRLGDFINFQKNVALLGAALTMLAIPSPWPYSILP